jgi:cytochrome P450 family 142 subfamily A polypeptide 1
MTAHLEQTSRIDLLDGDLYAGDPTGVYAWLRANAPVYYDEINGLWGISRHADICAIERDPQLWTSTGGYRPQLPSDQSMIGLDDPEHLHQRRLVYQRFSPRGAAGYEGRIRSVVTQIIDAALAKGTVDAVRDLAAPLPGRVIGWLLGFPDDRWPDLVRWSETTITAGGGRRYVTQDVIEAAAEFATAILELASARRREPRDDLVSLWVHSKDPIYDDGAIVSEALLLLDGGAETTRTVIADTINTLIHHPDQAELLRASPELIPDAVEEFIRWTTPILNMCRTATRDTVLHDQAITAGQQVMLMYGSANRDEAMFENADVFDVRRKPGAHIAFGLGTHFCLGAVLARLELRLFFEEYLRRIRHAEWADEVGPRRVRSAFVLGVSSFPVVVRG